MMELLLSLDHAMELTGGILMTGRFGMAVHAMALLAMFPESRHSSDEMASSIGTNPVLVRRLLSTLAKAGLVDNRIGKTGGSKLKRPASRIRLSQIYEAFEETPFHMHEHPNPDCPCGSSIEPALAGLFEKMEKAMKKELGRRTLENLVREMTEKPIGKK